MRFIGGRAARAQEATITTPTATIGIRGSSAFVQHVGGRTIAIFVAGERLCIRVGGQESCTSRRGGVLTEDGYRGSITAEDLAVLLEALDGAPPGGGGSILTGLQDEADPDQQPLSTRGEELDRGLFDRFIGPELDGSLVTQSPASRRGAGGGGTGGGTGGTGGGTGGGGTGGGEPGGGDADL